MGLFDFFKGAVSAYTTPIPRVFDQATFTPGSLWARVRSDGSVYLEDWPTPAANRRYSPPSPLRRAVALTASVRINGTWLKATPGAANPRGRINGWRIWPLEEWAGPAESMTVDAWRSLGFEAPPPQPITPYFAVIGVSDSTAHPAPRIEAARIRLITGEPWAASHPAIDVDAQRPWADLFERWHEALLLLGFTDEQARRAPRPHIDVTHVPGRGEWNKSLPPPQGFPPDGSTHILGWDLADEWHPMSTIQPFAGETSRIPCVWTLNRNDSYQPWAPDRIDRLPPDEAPGGADSVCAARICLSVTRPGQRSLLCEAASKRFYNVYSELDPSLIDPRDPASSSPLSEREERAWGIASWGRDGAKDAMVKRDGGVDVRASFIGIGPWRGRTAVVPLPAGTDLSNLFGRPDLVRSALHEIAGR